MASAFHEYMYLPTGDDLKAFVARYTRIELNPSERRQAYSCIFINCLPQPIDNIVFTCAVLHKMLLDIDEWSASDGEFDIITDVETDARIQDGSKNRKSPQRTN